MLDLDYMKSQLEKVIRSQDRDPPELAKSFDTDDIDALIREVEQLRDDSEALRLLRQLNLEANNVTDFFYLLLPTWEGSNDEHEVWEVVEERASGNVVSKGPTPLAAVQAALAKEVG